ncbi:MAG TPA: hypothetical protein VFT29_15595 [Gemmatimonadaceae bacterium]|nr:hypothetical protein [Gemmatimonadaceae bacterium]
MAINTSKVVVGGLAAGVAMNVIGFLGNGVLLGQRMRNELEAAAPTLAGKGMSGTIIATQVIMQFVIGILLVWLYAAMRPRFGPGTKTAAFAALVIWICGFLFYLDWLFLGMMRPGTYAMVSILQFVSLMVGAWVGGMLYKENDAAVA